MVYSSLLQALPLGTVYSVHCTLLQALSLGTVYNTLLQAQVYSVQCMSCRWARVERERPGTVNSSQCSCSACIGYSSLLQALSLGQGQEEAARHMLGEGLQKGHWVLLQNCHLSGLKY